MMYMQNNAMSQTLEKIYTNLVRWNDWGKKFEVWHTNSSTFVPGGTNGPYYDLETPLRNTSHWLCLNSILYKVCGDASFLDRANRLANYLVEHKSHADKHGYIYRQKAGKDTCNGVIGPAWHAEGLIKAGYYLHREDCLEKAKRILDPLQFSSKDGAWRRLDALKGLGKIDFTYNHQSWLAAIKSELSKNTDTESFLNSSLRHSFRVNESGLISHLLYSKTFHGLGMRFYFRLNEKRNPTHYESREIGYHLFVLHSLARLKHIYPHHPFFDSNKLLKAISYIDNRNFFKTLTTNKYAYPYNSPSYEAPLILLTWKKKFKNIDPEEVIDNLLNDLETYYAPWSENPSPQGIPDPITLFSRVYELAICLEHNFE